MGHGWIGTSPRDGFQECDLQRHFKEWHQRREERAGVPTWLQEVKMTPHPQGLSDAWGYGFIPDLVGTDGEQNYVFELKYGLKNEPLAVAEVLHHTQSLRDRAVVGDRWTEGKPVVPVIVGGWNAWTRASIDYFQRTTRTPLRFLEVVALQGPFGDSEVLWFEEYLGTGKDAEKGTWKQVSEPSESIASIAQPEAEWSKSSSSDAWRARARGRFDANPATPPPDEEYASVARVGTGEQFVAWWGRNHKDGPSHFHISGPKPGASDAQPPFRVR